MNTSEISIAVTGPEMESPTSASTIPPDTAAAPMDGQHEKAAEKSTEEGETKAKTKVCQAQLNAYMTEKVARIFSMERDTRVFLWMDGKHILVQPDPSPDFYFSTTDWLTISSGMMLLTDIRKQTRTGNMTFIHLRTDEFVQELARLVSADVMRSDFRTHGVATNLPQEPDIMSAMDYETACRLLNDKYKDHCGLGGAWGERVSAAP